MPQGALSAQPGRDSGEPVDGWSQRSGEPSWCIRWRWLAVRGWQTLRYLRAPHLFPLSDNYRALGGCVCTALPALVLLFMGVRWWNVLKFKRWVREGSRFSARPSVLTLRDLCLSFLHENRPCEQAELATLRHRSTVADSQGKICPHLLSWRKQVSPGTGTVSRKMRGVSSRRLLNTNSMQQNPIVPHDA